MYVSPTTFLHLLLFGSGVWIPLGPRAARTAIVLPGSRGWAGRAVRPQVGPLRAVTSGQPRERLNPQTLEAPLPPDHLQPLGPPALLGHLPPLVHPQPQEPLRLLGQAAVPPLRHPKIRTRSQRRHNSPASRPAQEQKARRRRPTLLQLTAIADRSPPSPPVEQTKEERPQIPRTSHQTRQPLESTPPQPQATCHHRMVVITSS